MARVLIVGMGVVGSNLLTELRPLSPDAYDKYQKKLVTKDGVYFGEFRPSGHYDFAFVCVDTPRADEACDVSEVRNAIMEYDADVYVIKSTVLPGTTKALRKETGKRIVFSPEYYGGTQHANNFDFDFTILGGKRKDCVAVVQLLQHVYDGRHQFRITGSKTAELAKYMENCWIATKVSFCNQFFDLAQHYGVCYEEMRELFLLDPRVNPSHTFCYANARGWNSHCLNKDVPAIAEVGDAPLLKAVIDYNESIRTQ